MQISRQGNILVITVKERPAISKIELKGNKDLKSEDLLKGLKDIGLAEGEPFDRLSLDRVTQELTRQYYNRGKYNVSIKPKVIPLDRNRVELSIVIAEGKVATIRHINITGNHAFSTDEIRSDFESNTSNWTSWYSKDDQYSREKLSGDLEKLNSYYLDRGHVDFSIDSTQVTISPDKRSMYLTANVTEGEVYTVSEVKLAGELVVTEEDMRKLIKINPGEVFSRKKIVQSQEAMIAVLANIGYAFAQVTPVPNVDKEKRTAAVTFFVNPGKRVYVRHVLFKGNASTQDEVMRREMRQLEGAWYSQAAIDRSKIRLQRLGFFKKVEISTPKVPGTDDQVDVNVTVEETSAGSFTFGLGYSQVEKLIASVSVSENNFLGTGDAASATVQKSYYLTRYNLNYYQPYLTPDGIGLGYDANYSKLDSAQINIASYFNNTASFSTFLGLPVTETDAVRLSMGISNTKIITYNSVPTQVIDPTTGLPATDLNGNPIYITDANGNIIYTRQYFSPAPIIDYINNLGHDTFHTWAITASWAHDTRNKYFNPTAWIAAGSSEGRNRTARINRAVLHPDVQVRAIPADHRGIHCAGVGNGRLRQQLHVDQERAAANRSNLHAGGDGPAVLQEFLCRRPFRRSQFPRQHARSVHALPRLCLGDPSRLLPPAARRRIQDRRIRRVDHSDAVREGRFGHPPVVVRRCRQRVRHLQRLLVERDSRVDRYIAALAGTRRPDHHQSRPADRQEAG